MPYLRHVREAVTCLWSPFDWGGGGVEFAIVHNLNKSKSPEIPHWQHDKFYLESTIDYECRTEFRFEKEHLYNLVDSLQLDEDQIFYGRSIVDPSEAFCMLSISRIRF